ncbi:hypothetical protein QAD02_000816 [Eretmocerus hayati]|uniref:Uncharacterized protein n=1 Tax=Eretmocerus hayati TaxID=131215 RepID=A0ACC2NEG9_9HYME|nr:hypothetical protein QAD02_000816 [Eretmocerus hayati]
MPKSNIQTEENQVTADPRVIDTVSEIMAIPASGSGVKRPLSISSASAITQPESGSLEMTSGDFKTPNKVVKKYKKEVKSRKVNLSKHLQAAKENVNKNNGPFPITFDKLKEFLEKAYVLPEENYVSTANKYTTDTVGLHDMLGETLSHINNRTLRRKILRIRELLIPPTSADERPQELSEYESDTDASVYESENNGEQMSE